MALATTSYDLYPHLAKLLGIPETMAVRKLTLSVGFDDVPIVTLETIAARTGEVEQQRFALLALAIQQTEGANHGTEATATART